MWLALLAQLASAADLVVDGVTTPLSGVQTFDQVRVVNGGVLQVPAWDGVSGGSLELHAASVLVDATSSITADAAGYRGGGIAAVGEGPGGGGNAGTNGGGGGGHGGPGGDGLEDVYLACNLYSSNNGGTYDTAIPSTTAEMGSGGAGGNGNGTGGAGGGAVAIFAPLIEVYGTISADGADGVGGANDAGGAGAGGGILLAGDVLDCTGVLSAVGGDGTIPANGTDGGGAGGGGVIEQYFSTSGAICASDVSSGLDRCGATGGATGGAEGAEDPGDTYFDWDSDGLTVGDCDVHDPAIGAATSWYPDADGDGFGAGAATIACAAPAGSVATPGDCDDGDPLISPDAAELPSDGIDEDCDGGELCNADADDDGAGAAELVASADRDCADANEATDASDCDDLDITVHPGAVEIVADGADQDCDGGDACWLDADLDGVGTVLVTPSADLDCADPGEAAAVVDCNDQDPGVFPGNPEIVADGIDQDCDGRDACYQDLDQDGWGSSVIVASAYFQCVAPDFESPIDGDCDDADPASHPGADEIPGDGADQSCDGLDGCYADLDGDGSGGPDPVVSADADCRDAGESSDDLDCDDTSAATAPGAPELPGDGIDEDCDGTEGCYTDADGDGAGGGTIVRSDDADCADAGEAAAPDDCDDADPDRFPGAAEVPSDGIDQDCDGSDATMPDDPVDPVDTGGATGAGVPSVDDRPQPSDGEGTGGGCDCDTAARPPGAWAVALGLLVARRRRR